ncbi:hypothetical protein [Lignipirellula cremea]|uniref:NolW-like domain-containing protein n=1 Tax=Lignipirellula cremea TaxID=2528010 RepID=A0A518DLQ1_9BACT|nr:hypothetical protein [Lignipirellula cremea]QDU92768.1 hypothetical protein Pla8534_05170 [Lignipirellula cremea]
MQRFFFSFSLAVILAACSVSHAQPPSRSPTLPSDPPATVAETEAAIRAAFDKPFTGEFNATPLSEVAKHLQQTFQINVDLDRRALDGVGIAADTPVTFAANNRTLRSSLRLMLRELELTWVVANETLVITTPDEAEGHVLTRVYPVGDLATRSDESSTLLSWEAGGGKFDDLRDLITSTIAPEMWADVGGRGSISDGAFQGRDVLIVSQTEEVHDQIAHLFRQMRTFPAAPRPKQAEASTGLRVYRLTPKAAEKKEEIVAMLRRVVEAESWNQKDVQLEFAADALVIRQSREAHRQIQDLLEALDALAPVVVDFNGFGGQLPEGQGGSFF